MSPAFTISPGMEPRSVFPICFRRRESAVFHERVNGRAVGITLGVVLGLIVLGLGGYYAFTKLWKRPTHDVVITYRRHATALDNDTQLALTTARALSTRSPRIKRMRSESTQDRVTIACSFESKPIDFEDDNRAIANTTEQVLRSLNHFQAPPTIEDAEPAQQMIVFSKTDLFGELDQIRGVSVWRGCGARPLKRFRVRLDPAKLNAYKIDPVDFIPALENKVADGGATAQTILDFPVKDYLKIEQVSQMVAQESPPPACTVVTINADDSPMAFRVKLHPKIFPEDRGKFDSAIKDAGAKVLTEKDYSEVRFFPTADASYDDAVQLARNVVAAAYSDAEASSAATRVGPPRKTAGLPVIAAMMTNEGFGTLIVKSEAKDDAIRAFFEKTETKPGWGGIRGRRYLQITVQDGNREVVEQQSQAIIKKIGKIEGIGERIMTAPPSHAAVTYQIDELKALTDNVDSSVIRALIPTGAVYDTTMPVTFDAPFDAIHLRGKPVSEYVTVRTTMAASRLLRINAQPAAELRWELPDPKVMKRVRQVVGESPAVTVEDVAASSR